MLYRRQAASERSMNRNCIKMKLFRQFCKSFALLCNQKKQKRITFSVEFMISSTLRAAIENKMKEKKDLGG